MALDLSKLSIRRACIENAASPSPRSAGEIAAVLGVPGKRVHEAMSRLRRAGRLRRSERQVARAIGRPEQETTGAGENGTASIDPAALLEDTATEVGLTNTEKRQILSRLARTAPTPVRVSAVRALDEHDRATGVQIGPPEPCGDAQLAERVATLLVSVGSEVGEVAIRDARARWAEEQRPAWYIDGMATRKRDAANVEPS